MNRPVNLAMLKLSVPSYALITILLTVVVSGCGTRDELRAARLEIETLEYALESERNMSSGLLAAIDALSAEKYAWRCLSGIAADAPDRYSWRLVLREWIALQDELGVDFIPDFPRDDEIRELSRYARELRWLMSDNEIGVCRDS